MEIVKGRTGSYPDWDSMDKLTAQDAYHFISGHYERWKEKWENSKVAKS